ncbi:MAG: hypothetical protein ACFWUD_07760 [Thermocaproicibacter melissae]|jgi:hypothetical protein|uniref:PP2C family serine/threonine-protein phosphatase n=1 Tax=Thermocaproicibacter melissae TaxID=2966552 RepID=UPI0024B05373|nr:PP2C family serine/threonine-protein phosphatase [Thermocaproicibacter melissae]WBY64538.1 PP2C family serine/threonine-protein phosphatase [Thermocaproicibacter melissae]
MKAGTDYRVPSHCLVDFHVTVRGASHTRKQQVCQDFSCSAHFGDSAAAAVADGHGDKRYFRSDVGSQLAASAALHAVREFVKREGRGLLSCEVDAKLEQLKKNIILSWNRKVAAHYASHPFSEEELSPLSEHRRELLRNGQLVETAYGTTLIAAAVTPYYWFGLQIGDGDCFAVCEGEKVFVPKEEGLIGNITTSLCEPDAYYKFHHIFGLEKPSAVVMTTDGVRNSFASREYYTDFMDQVIRQFSAGRKKKTSAELKSFLADMSERGSGDDLSVAGITETSFSDKRKSI